MWDETLLSFSSVISIRVWCLCITVKLLWFVSPIETFAFYGKRALSLSTYCMRTFSEEHGFAYWLRRCGPLSMLWVTPHCILMSFFCLKSKIVLHKVIPYITWNFKNYEFDNTLKTSIFQINWSQEMFALCVLWHLAMLSLLVIETQ